MLTVRRVLPRDPVVTCEVVAVGDTVTLTSLAGDVVFTAAAAENIAAREFKCEDPGPWTDNDTAASLAAVVDGHTLFDAVAAFNDVTASLSAGGDLTATSSNPATLPVRATALPRPLFDWATELAIWTDSSPADPADAIDTGELLAEVTETIEDHLERAVMTTTFEAVLDPEDLDAGSDHATAVIALPRVPLQRVRRVRWIDEHQAEHEVDPSDYQVIPGEYGLLLIPRSLIRSWDDLRQYRCLMVEYDAGYGDVRRAVPKRIQLAVRELFTFYRQHRGEGFVLRRVVSGEMGGEQLSYTPRYQVAKIMASISRFRVRRYS